MDKFDGNCGSPKSGSYLTNLKKTKTDGAELQKGVGWKLSFKSMHVLSLAPNIMMYDGFKDGYPGIGSL